MLLVRPLPEVAESLRGYLLRLSSANGIDSPGLLPARYVDALICRSRPITILRGPITGHPHLVRSDVGQLPPRYWNNRRPRYCPECLRDKPIWRSLWELVFFTDCPHHRIELIDYCSCCGQHLRWKRSDLLTCSCGAQLCDAPAAESSVGALAISAELAKAWDDGHERAPTADDALSTCDLLRRTWFLGAYASRSNGRAMKVGNLFDVKVARRFSLAAHLPRDQGFEALFAWFEHVVGNYGSDQSMRLTTRFGAMYKELFDSSSERALHDIRSGFERYVAERWPGQLAARNRRLSPELLNHHAWIPLTRAAAELHWKMPRLRSLVERGAVRGQMTQHHSGRIFGTIHREDLNRLLSDAGDELNLLDVCSLLKLGKISVKALVSNGRLQPTSGPAVDGSAIWRFKRIEVDSIRSRMTEGAHLTVNS